MISLLLTMTIFTAPFDPILNQTSDIVCACHVQSDEIQGYIEQMMDVAYGNRNDRNKSILVGLAAPQIGIQKRIILVDLAATGKFSEITSVPSSQIEAFIDPEILWQSDEVNYWREGCFSTHKIHGIVPRANRILVRAYDREGNIFTREFEGYTARIFQHEIDHLNAIRFPDRILNDDDLHWVEHDEITRYRTDWASWQKKCPRKIWIDMKNGKISS